MRMTLPQTSLTVMTALFLYGCVIEDADRCADNLQWNEAQAESALQETLELRTELAETRDNLDAATAGAMNADTANLLSIYGFFDVTFIQSFYEQDNSAPGGIDSCGRGEHGHTAALLSALAVRAIMASTPMSDDTLDWYGHNTLRVGLNVRSSPYVALKAEGVFDFLDELLGGQMNSIAGQLAVSF